MTTKDQKNKNKTLHYGKVLGDVHFRHTFFDDNKQFIKWISLNAVNTTTKMQRAAVPKFIKKSKRKVQGVPQSQTAALPRPQEEEETDKSKQAQTEQTYEKH